MPLGVNVPSGFTHVCVVSVVALDTSTRPPHNLAATAAAVTSGRPDGHTTFDFAALTAAGAGGAAAAGGASAGASDATNTTARPTAARALHRRPRRSTKATNTRERHTADTGIAPSPGPSEPDAKHRIGTRPGPVTNRSDSCQIDRLTCGPCPWDPTVTVSSKPKAHCYT